MKTTKKTLTLVPLALIATQIFTGCVIVDEGYDDDDRYSPPPRSTTTTTTTTETEVVYEETEVVYEEEEIIVEESWVPAFAPVMGAVSGELLDYDPYYETSWLFYTYNFSDVSDSYACDAQMSELSVGSVATVHLNGYEVDDEFAACPTGRYMVVPDCELYEGEACVEILFRDEYGYEVGRDWAYTGVVDVTVEPGWRHGDPHLCNITTSVDGHPDMNFSFDLIFDPYDLSSQDRLGGSICTM